MLRCVCVCVFRLRCLQIICEGHWLLVILVHECYFLWAPPPRPPLLLLVLLLLQVVSSHGHVHPHDVASHHLGGEQSCGHPALRREFTGSAGGVYRQPVNARSGFGSTETTNAAEKLMQRERGAMVPHTVWVCHTPAWLWWLLTVCVESSGNQNTEGCCSSLTRWTGFSWGAGLSRAEQSRAAQGKGRGVRHTERQHTLRHIGPGRRTLVCSSDTVDCAGSTKAHLCWIWFIEHLNSVMDSVIIYIDACGRWYSGHALRQSPANKGKREGENDGCSPSPVFKRMGEAESKLVLVLSGMLGSP